MPRAPRTCGLGLGEGRGRYKICREEGAVEQAREKIEDFLRRWRSRYEGDRVFRVLVITVVLAAWG